MGADLYLNPPDQSGEIAHLRRRVAELEQADDHLSERDTQNSSNIAKETSVSSYWETAHDALMGRILRETILEQERQQREAEARAARDETLVAQLASLIRTRFGEIPGIQVRPYDALFPFPVDGKVHTMSLSLEPNDPYPNWKLVALSKSLTSIGQSTMSLTFVGQPTVFPDHSWSGSLPDRQSVLYEKCLQACGHKPPVVR